MCSGIPLRHSSPPFRSTAPRPAPLFFAQNHPNRLKPQPNNGNDFSLLFQPRKGTGQMAPVKALAIRMTGRASGDVCPKRYLHNHKKYSHYSAALRRRSDSESDRREALANRTVFAGPVIQPAQTPRSRAAGQVTSYFCRQSKAQNDFVDLMEHIGSLALILFHEILRRALGETSQTSIGPIMARRRECSHTRGCIKHYIVEFITRRLKCEAETCLKSVQRKRADS